MSEAAIYWSRLTGRLECGRTGSLATGLHSGGGMRHVFLAVIAMMALATARSQTIETRKVATLADRDGKGFTRAPSSVAPVGKWFAMTAMNELPLVVDSSGR